MQFAARIIVSIFVLTSALATAYHNSAKLRRDGVLNLYPFPRVGRANHRTWEVPVNDFYLEDYEPVQKRQMYAFPRVGRSDPHDFQSVRHPDTAMWYGPKLQRIVSEYEPIEKRQLYAFPRVGRDARDSLRPDQMQSPIRRTDSPGMWFGPRLGRSVKTDDDDIMIQNEANERSQPEQMEVDHMDRKKRQTRPL
ncbi:CAPA peptides [Pectinophora gossypiella]|uniref:CAPA peptides n=1 Tax=Pectinophora gossypiella TaxID=13191 RepID=UPI00214F4F2A|nr:CAPA peptides [Pectinophora gossypiella]